MQKTVMQTEQVDYLYLLGLEHSGSTLVAFLLNSHPAIASVGETAAVDQILPARWETGRGLCSCGRAYVSCPFWIRTLAGLSARGFGLGSPNPFGPQPEPQADEKLAAFAHAALDVQQKQVFLDASKKADYLPRLAANPYLNLKVLDLYRDGRGIVNSWRKNNPNRPVEELTREWIRREERRQQVLDDIDAESIFRLGYEALCQDPAGWTEQILAFLNLVAGAFSTGGFKSDAEHHIIGNPMRLDENETIRLDESWRRELTTAMLADFASAGGTAANAQNGYLD
jgi:hypothetical protein